MSRPLPSPNRGWLPWVVTGLAACSPGVEFVTLPNAEWPFFLIVEGVGRAPETSGPYRWSEAEPAFRIGVRGVERLEWVSVDVDGVLEAVPSAASDADEGVRLELVQETCSEGRPRGGGLRVPLDDDHARSYRLEDGQFRPIALEARSPSIWVPTDEARCFDTPPLELIPYGDTASLLPPGVFGATTGAAERQRTITTVRPLGAGRILAATWDRILVLERGQPWVAAPGRSWNLTVPGPPPSTDGGWMLRGLTVGTATEAEGVTEIVFIAGWHSLVDGAEDSVVGRMEWSERLGFSAPRYSNRTEAQLRYLGRAPDGRWVVVGHRGTVLVRAPDASEFQAIDVSGTNLAGVQLRSWAPGFNPTEPDVLIDVGGTLHFGYLEDGAPWRSEPSALGGFESNLVTLSAAGGVEAFWATGTPPFARRFADGRRALLTGYVPPALSDCAGTLDACERLSFSTGQSTHITATPSRTLVLGATFCSALVEYHPERRCSRPILERGAPVDARALAMSSLTGTPEGLFVTGPAGRLLFAPWSE